MFADTSMADKNVCPTVAPLVETCQRNLKHYLLAFAQYG